MDDNNRNGQGDIMIPFKEIQAARGGCPDCDGRGEVGGSSPGLVEIFETLPCPTCNGSGNGIIKHWQKIDVPVGYVGYAKTPAGLSIASQQKFKSGDTSCFKHISFPHKVGDTITETCDACLFWRDCNKHLCVTCKGNPIATLTCQKIEYQMKDGEHGFYTEWREKPNDRD